MAKEKQNLKKFLPFLIVIFFVFLPVHHARAVIYNASGLLGQTNFISSDATTTQSGFNYPAGAALDTINHRLFVNDCAGHREMVFQLDANNNIATTSASYVLGQSNFTSSTATTTQNGMSRQGGACGPYGGSAYDSTNSRLFVPDSSNNRVLVFNVSPGTIANGENASYVLGQPNFTTNTATTTQSGFDSADGLAYDATNNRLFAVDQNNNRVLVFNVSPGTIANGENASYVLGQSNFTTNTATTTQSGLSNAVGLSYDATNQRLFVADSNNNRVMTFNVDPSTITNGENANYVLGQPNFTTSTNLLTQNGMYFPDGVAFEPTFNRLYVADDGYNRIMVFDVAPSNIVNGENALNVLGEPDFTSNSGGITTQSGLNDPEGNIAYDSTNHKLFVPDSSNNRVLIFSLIHITTSSLPDGTAGSTYSQTITSTSSQSTVSFAVQSGSLPTGLSLNTSSGVISGTPSSAGTYSFTIEADDTSSTGVLLDRKDYTVNIAAVPAPMPTPSSGGGGLPPAFFIPPSSPTGGLKVNINNNAATTGNPQVNLTFSTGGDVKNMAIGNAADLAGSGQEPYQPTKIWNLCWTSGVLQTPVDCAPETKTVYAKFYTQYGTPSAVISASINYQPSGNNSLSSNTNSQPTQILNNFVSNTLVLDKGTIWLIIGNTKIGFTSMNVFKTLGYSLKNVVMGDTSNYQASVNYILNNSTMSHPWGSWVVSKKTVYYISEQGLIPISSWNIFLSNGGQAKFIINANNVDLALPKLSLMLEIDSRVK